MTLGPHDVHIWHRFTELLGDDEVKSAASLLSADERARYERFVFADDRRDYAAAHALLRRALSAYEPIAPETWQFDTNVHGKPSVAQTVGPRSRLAFNLSHTRGLVACAIARDTDIGLDVELVDRPGGHRDVAERYFSPAEIAGIDGCPESGRRSRFIELWTLKEACLKAIGTGLSNSLQEFVIAFEGSGDLRLESVPDSLEDDWQLALFAPSDRHRMAVAIRRTDGRRWRITTLKDDGASSEARLLRTSVINEQ